MRLQHNSFIDISILFVHNFNITGSEYASWKRQLRQKTREVTKELFGKEMDPIPVAVKFDCAMELANGTILGYREEGQVDTGKMYANVVFLLLLRYEHMTKM